MALTAATRPYCLCHRFAVLRPIGEFLLTLELALLQNLFVVIQCTAQRQGLINGAGITDLSFLETLPAVILILRTIQGAYRT